MHNMYIQQVKVINVLNVCNIMLHCKKLNTECNVNTHIKKDPCSSEILIIKNIPSLYIHNTAIALKAPITQLVTHHLKLCPVDYQGHQILTAFIL